MCSAACRRNAEVGVGGHALATAAEAADFYVAS